MTKKIPILDADYAVVYQSGKEWLEYNKYITPEEAEKKAAELTKKGMKAKVVKNVIRQREIEVPTNPKNEGPY